MAEPKETAQAVLDNVGGSKNVRQATHCMTRLRLNLKDKSLADVDAIKATPGVLGAHMMGEQLQVIIGAKVEKVYNEFIALSGLEAQAAIDENLDAITPKERLTVMGLVNKTLDAIAGSITPILPILIVAGMVKMIASLIGPSMLNLVPDTDDLFVALSFVGDAGFYFLPFYVAYSASKKFEASTPVSMLLAGILMHPTVTEILTAITDDGLAFSIYGIPVTGASYASTVLPIIFIVFIQSHLERGLRKIIPDSVKVLFLPLLTVLIMLPIELCAIGPLGTILGNGLAVGLSAVHKMLGPIGVGIIGSLFILIVATGMHVALMSIGILSIASVGFDSFIFVGSITGTYACIALYLAYVIKAKNADDRQLGISCLVSQALGGIGEPGMFGILFTHKRGLAYEMIAAFCGGLYAGITNCAVYFLGSSNFLAATVFASPTDPMGIVNGAIACGIAFTVAFGLAMIFGFEDDTKGIKEILAARKAKKASA